MMHSTPTAPTMKDAISHMEAHGTDNQKQDIRKARIAFALHDIEAADFDTFPADVAVFDRSVAKLTGTMPGLQRLIKTAGLSDNTYKQAWRAARRLITEFTGASAEKNERRAQDDAWANLNRKVTALVEAGMADRFVLRGLPALTDACRVLHLEPADLDAEAVTTLLNTDGAHKRKTLRKGLKALDSLREISRLTELLPLAPVTPASKPAGRLVTLPAHLQVSINGWVQHAAREKVKDPRHDHLAEPLSESARGRYSAALSLWVQTLLLNGAYLDKGTGLTELFTSDQIDHVLGLWSSSKAHSARTYYNYTIDLAALLSRHGLSEEASYMAGMPKVMGRLQEGRAAGKTMSTKVRRWCKALLRDPQKVALFDSQHYEYFRVALETLSTAKIEGFDLRTLSDPEEMSALPPLKRSRAKHLLQRSRQYGVLATYAAIALEGAPYRRQNILGIRHTGPKKTMHIHLTDSNPHVIIKFPNEELKNGKWLTMRNEELDPVTVERRHDADYAPEILKFYLQKIRPLFHHADRTHCLFPPIERADTTEAALPAGTFDIWMAEGSTEIGLPQSSHNFRHGYCSIAINEGRVSIEDLAKIMGDTVTTLQRYYAWINGEASVAAVQKDISRRRAESARARKVLAQ